MAKGPANAVKIDVLIIAYDVAAKTVYLATNDATKAFDPTTNDAIAIVLVAVAIDVAASCLILVKACISITAHVLAIEANVRNGYAYAVIAILISSTITTTNVGLGTSNAEPANANDAKHAVVANELDGTVNGSDGWLRPTIIKQNGILAI